MTQAISNEVIVRLVLSDPEMLTALNDNPMKVSLSDDGTEAELNIGEVVPYVVEATLNALAALGVVQYEKPEETVDETRSVG